MTLDERIKSARERILKISVATQHRLERDKWLNTRRILDQINTQLAVLEDGPQRVRVELHTLPPEQQRILHTTLRSLLDADIATFGVNNLRELEDDCPQPITTLSSETARKFFDGEDVVIKNTGLFEDYHLKI